MVQREVGERFAAAPGTPAYGVPSITRLGYGEEVGIVAELWQSGKREEARQAVPIDLGRLTNLVGTPDGIAERVGKYRAGGITTLLAKLEGDYSHQLATLERLLDIIADR